MMSDAYSTNGNTIIAAIVGAALFALLTAVITYIVRAAGKNSLEMQPLRRQAFVMLAAR